MAQARRSVESKAADGNWPTTKFRRNWIAPETATESPFVRATPWDYWLDNDGVIRDTVEGHGCCQGRNRAGDEDRRRERPPVFSGCLARCDPRRQDQPAPIELIVENTDYFRVVKLDYHGGEKYPASGAGRVEAGSADGNLSGEVIVALADVVAESRSSLGSGSDCVRPGSSSDR